MGLPETLHLSICCYQPERFHRPSTCSSALNSDRRCAYVICKFNGLLRSYDFLCSPLIGRNPVCVQHTPLSFHWLFGEEHQTIAVLYSWGILYVCTLKWSLFAVRFICNKRLESQPETWFRDLRTCPKVLFPVQTVFCSAGNDAGWEDIQAIRNYWSPILKDGWTATIGATMQNSQ